MPLTFVPARTPDRVTPSVLAACKRLAPESSPEFVDRRPLPDGRVNKCTYNVQQFVERSGGEILLGWELSVWDGVMLECIGHAVVRHGDTKICVTPSEYGEHRLLFLPDKRLTFDFSDANARMPARELALSSRPDVARLIEVRRREREIKTRYPVTSGQMVVQGADAIELQRLGAESNRLFFSVLLATSDHSTRCPCGSGKKFRKCHRQQVERMVSLA